MARWTPDPTFYPSPGSAAGAPRETVAYVSAVAGSGPGAPAVPASRREPAPSPELFALRGNPAPVADGEENVARSTSSASLFVPLSGGVPR